MQWTLYRFGAKPPAQSDVQRTHQRNVTIYRFTRAEDRYIEELRRAGAAVGEIARKASEQFGTNRTRHTIRVRLIILAGRGIGNLVVLLALQKATELRVTFQGGLNG